MAATTIKQYSLAVGPSSVGAGSTATYSFTISNVNPSQQQLGSANIVAATSSTTGRSFVFPVQTIGAPLVDGTTAMGSAARTNASTIAVRGLSLQPGHSATITFAAEAPCPAAANYTWTATVKQANDFNGPPGNNFNQVGSPAVTEVTGVCHLEVSAPGPQDTGIGKTITDDIFSSGGPIHVAVMSQPTATTPTSTLATSSTASVTMTAADSNGGPLTLGGSSTVAASGGVASFGNLSIGVKGMNDTLHAAPTAPAASGIDPPGATSGPFTVADSYSDCTKKCSAPDTDGTTNVVVSSTATSGILAVTLGIQFPEITVCPGSTYVLPPSDGATFNLYEGSGSKTIQYTILNPDRPGSQFEVCFASTVDFPTLGGGMAAPYGSSGYFIGLLPHCKTAAAPCYDSYAKNPKTGAITLTSFTPPEGDPWTH
jgi:hypothetical protein